MPEGKKGTAVDVSIILKEGIENVTPEEIILIESNLTELVKLMLEEMACEED